jgi:predicted NACHT family NTPase
VPVGSAEPEPLELALGNSRLLLIRGEAGFGKTTLMQWLAVQGAKRALTGPIARWNRTVPFYLRLRDWSDSDQPFPAPEQFLSGPFQNLVGIMPQRWVHDMLKQDAVVLVDAVDEMPASRRRRLFDWLEELVTMFPPPHFYGIHGCPRRSL